MREFGPVSHKYKTYLRAALPVLAAQLMVSVVSAQNATPFIDIVKPPSAQVGSGNLAVTIVGTGFAPGATVNFSGVTLKPTSVTGTHIRVTVPAANLATAHTANIRVFNPLEAPLSGESNFVYFPIAKPEMSVKTVRTDVTVPAGPSSIVTADFNGDGKRDVAIVDASGVTVLLGKGDGTFATASTTPMSAVGIAVGDFNGDGIKDLAVSGYTANSFNAVTILLGKGDGTFNVGWTFPVSQNPIGNIMAGDFNQDGNLDLAVVFPRPAAITIFLGNGDGTFYVGGGAGGFPNIIYAAIGDVNGDGKLDVVSFDTYYGFEVALGKGDGTFLTQPGPAVNGNVSFFALGDFNADGKLDLAVSVGNAVSSQGPGTVSVLLGKGDGTFTMGTSVDVGDYPGTIGVGDLNGDGKLDLAVHNLCGNDVSCQSNSTVSILLGKGDGTFTALSSAPSVGLGGFGLESPRLALVDLNRDGRLDIVTANGGASSLSILLQAGAKAAAETDDIP